MQNWIKAWLAAGITFLVLDGLWLGFVVPRLYPPLIGDVLATQARLAPAIAFYLIYISGLVFFAVAPGAAAGSLRTAAARGAMLGLVAYGTYDLTNQATLKVWDIRVTLADMTWGTLLSAISAAVSFRISRERD